MNVVTLKAGREKSLRRRHPWVFSGAVDRVEGNPSSGDTVEIRSSDGKPFALAAWSPQSQIRCRVWSFDCSAVVDEEFLAGRVKRALSFRASLPAARHTNAMRLVHGESDGLPGLIVDRYADVLVAQFLSAGAERWREAILDALASEPALEGYHLLPAARGDMLERAYASRTVVSHARFRVRSESAEEIVTSDYWMAVGPTTLVMRHTSSALMDVLRPAQSRSRSAASTAMRISRARWSRQMRSIDSANSRRAASSEMPPAAA